MVILYGNLSQQWHLSRYCNVYLRNWYNEAITGGIEKVGEGFPFLDKCMTMRDSFFLFV